MVRSDTIDIAIVSTEPSDLPGGIASKIIDVDHLMLAGPHGHRLEHYDVVPVRELDGCDMISFRPGAGLRHAADVVLAEAGVTANIVIESNEMPVLVGLVSHGLGLAILPEAFIEHAHDQVWGRPLDPAITPPLALIWRERRRRSPAAEAFLRHISDGDAGLLRPRRS
jgi:DNA-binding transcriptional LysR family regulator